MNHTQNKKMGPGTILRQTPAEESSPYIRFAQAKGFLL